MRKKVQGFILLVLYSVTIMSAQTNFSYIIPFSGLHNPQNFELKDSFCYISTINLIENVPSSSILKVNLNNGNTYQKDFKGYAITREGIIENEGKIISFGDYISSAGKSIYTLILDDNLEIVDSFLTDEKVVPGGSTSFAAYDTLIYGTLIHDEELNGDIHRRLRILKVSPDLDYLAIDTIYNDDLKISYGWKSIITPDNELLLSVGIAEFNNPYRYPQLIKLDQFGNLILNIVKNEALEDFGDYIIMSLLSNKNIVQAYEVDKRGESDFFLNNRFIEPTKFNIYNSQGDLLKEKLIITDENIVPRFYNLISGRNSTFYSIGSIENIESELIHGLILKLDSNLDTIWSGQYLHPEFNEERVYHEIIDVTELDNGGLMILAFILVDFITPKLWLFTVDENGNQSSNTSNVIVDNSSENHNDCFVYPNPAENIIKLKKTTTKPTNITIYNQQGICVLTKENFYKNEINVESLLSGLYFVILEYNSTFKETCMFIKSN